MRVSTTLDITTPWSVYAATFSPDGRWLAYGGGFYYGQGHLSLVDLRRKTTTGSPPNLLEPIRADIVDTVLHSGYILPRYQIEETARKLNLAHFTISGLCWDDTVTYLAASVWRACHEYYPTLLFHVRNGHVTLDDLFVEDVEWARSRRAEDRDYATGTLLLDDRLVVRRTTESIHRTFYAFHLPSEVRGGGVPHHLTSSRLAVVDGGVATGSSPWIDGDPALRISTDARTGALAGRELPCPDGVVVSAVTASDDGSLLLAGGSDGALRSWEFPAGRLLRRHDPGVGAAVTAACHLCIEPYLTTADDSGRVVLWRDHEKVLEWSVPDLSSRALACHPLRPRIAVGGKSAHGRSDPGRLLVFDLDLG